MEFRSLVFSSFAGDSLALAAHWLYNQQDIENKFGTITSFLEPLAGSYHAGKRAGDFTHYGDQTLVLLRSLVRHGGFELERFGSYWHDSMRDYQGYQDKATSQTLAALQGSADYTTCGSSSSELGGAARIAPLVYLYRDNEEQLLKCVREQAALTHNSHALLSGAEILARASLLLLDGEEMEDALSLALDAVELDLDLSMRLYGALDSAGRDNRDALKEFGLGCNISNALPGVIHLALSYSDDIVAGLATNVMAGGDSAARGLALGLLLGAANPGTPLPPDWSAGMGAAAEIGELLDGLDTLAG